MVVRFGLVSKREMAGFWCYPFASPGVAYGGINGISLNTGEIHQDSDSGGVMDNWSVSGRPSSDTFPVSSLPGPDQAGSIRVWRGCNSLVPARQGALIGGEAGMSDPAFQIEGTAPSIGIHSPLYLRAM